MNVADTLKDRLFNKPPTPSGAPLEPHHAIDSAAGSARLPQRER